MKHIQAYKIFENQVEPEHPGFPETEEEIHRLCKKYRIKNYTINSDLSIDVNETININVILKKYLPLNFNVVKGDFYCQSGILSSLKGSPRKIYGDFYCHNNNLKTLEGSPEYVEGEYHCDRNKLKNLKGSPKEVKMFGCAYNKLISLEGMPDLIKGDFDCSVNKLKNFKPSGVTNGEIYIFNNIISVLIHILIDKENRDELINEFNHYKITDGEVVYKERLEMFCGDFDLQMPNMELVKQHYKIV